MKRLFPAFLMSGLIGLAPLPVHACAVCFGRAGDHTTEAISMAILFLLGLVLLVLGTLLAFFIYLIRRSSQPDDGIEELAEIAYQEGTNISCHSING